MATPQAFERQPHIVHEFYNLRRRGLLSPDIQPNEGHKALVGLEENWPADVLIVTQNVDDLHERAGSQNLCHMHGELLKSRCHFCGDIKPCQIDLDVSMACEACGEVGGLRPDIVWFGEMPMGDEVIYKALPQAKIFISIGTSGNVYPAASFVNKANRRGAVTIECNLEPSENADAFDYGFYGAGIDILPDFVDCLLRSAGLSAS